MASPDPSAVHSGTTRPVTPSSSSSTTASGALSGSGGRIPHGRDRLDRDREEGEVGDRDAVERAYRELVEEHRVLKHQFVSLNCLCKMEGEKVPTYRPEGTFVFV